MGLFTHGHPNFGIIFMVGACLWTIESALTVIVFRQARKTFRARGHSARDVAAVGGTAAATAIALRS